jgi:AraC-like DNA-binding protein
MAAALMKIIAHGNDYIPGGPAARLALVMLDELAGMRFAGSPLPVSSEPRVARVMKLLLADPLANSGIRDLASASGASPRTLARLFRTQTGMTLGQWRTNLTLQEAIRRLAQGASVTDVAFELGYSSASAFTYMFRRNLGVAPRSYRE